MYICSVNSVYKKFPMSIEHVYIEQAVSSKDGGQVGEKEDGGRLDKGGIVRGLNVLAANVWDLKSGMKYEELQLLESELDIVTVAITESCAYSSVMDA